MTDAEVCRLAEEIDSRVAGIATSSVRREFILLCLRERLPVGAGRRRPPPPPEGSPVDEAALLDIRDEVALGDQDRTAARSVLKLMLRDLLAAYDHLLARLDEMECWLAVLAQDREADAGQQEIGVARALEVLRQENDKFYNGRSGVKGEIALALVCTDHAIRRQCGPCELPPHERSLARLRKMEEAMRRIARGGSEDVSWIAREALEDWP